MKKFVIERIIPGAANFSKGELQLISHIFCEAANKVETSYTWVQSFITDDKIYCIHIAENKETIREHSKISRFPINTINEVKTTVYPTTSDGSI